MLARSAHALEHSARLADEQAFRYERQGRPADGAAERRVALRARAYAARMRVLAAQD